VGTIKVATAAFDATYDVSANLERHIRLIDEAADRGASLVVFPEISLQGYPRDVASRDYESEIREVFATAESVPDGPSVARIVEASKRRGIHVVFGMTEATPEPGVLYNSMVLTGPDGYIGTYRKVHLGVAEQVFWRAGDQWPVFDTAIGRLGMLICWDKMFPETTRELTLAGAQILIMSTAWALTPGEYAEDEANQWAQQADLLDRARAFENGRWFISSNVVGELGGLDFFGRSNIVDPLGNVIASTAMHAPGLAFADIDVDAGLREAIAMNQGPFVVRDRRPETYRRLAGVEPVAIQA
jgi:predicted amidohydrolase